MVALYAVTIFTSAALLFLVQPMFARMVLPLLGGSPAVWNTAMVFYQAALLAGYAYAHASTAWLGVRRQAGWHLLVLLIPLVVLPIAIPAGWAPPTQDNPAPWMLALMAVAVGLPFFAISTTSPVLQKWFASTGHRQSADPYFLYVASNLGSMLALLSYPGWVEAHLSLAEQSRAWMWGYGLLVALAGGCAAWQWKTSAASVAAPAVVPVIAAKLPPRRRLRWVLLSFVPSSLMLGVTTYLSSDLAAVPLLWVIPLALYLLTFIFAFARRQLFPRPLLARALPITLVALVVALNMQATQPIGWLMLLHLTVFFVAALRCHTELAAERPEAAHLTEFYLWMSVGGVLGGIFNALLAPLVFNSVAEYPLTLVLACLVGWPAVSAGGSSSARLGDWLWPVGLGLLTVGLVLALQASRFQADAPVSGLLFGGPALICFFFSRRPLRFGLGIGALLLAGSLYQGERGRVLHVERSFFGVHRVTLDPTGRFHQLVHGMTLHGMQSVDPARRGESLTYYHRTGPIGEVLALYGRDASKTIGAVGLGAGSLASFASPRQSWTYFEIDPVVLKLARDETYFTFLRDSPAAMRVVLGDARRSLGAEPDGKFDVLVLDAYSSDAIPVHLVTREALALYRRKLAQGGLLAFHISNLHLDLEPVFAGLARDAGLVCLTRDDTEIGADERALGKAPSIWLVMARGPADLAQLANDSRWHPSRGQEGPAVWTDDYSSLLSVFRWR
ncbi:MAG: hypothetical protein EXS38_08540 [Opitutus sp.]|nr:hypothetical protein [Opitutus sp.]